MAGPLLTGEENSYDDTAADGPLTDKAAPDAADALGQASLPQRGLGWDSEHGEAGGGEDAAAVIDLDEWGVWWDDLAAQGPLVVLVTGLWGVSGVAHAAFLTGAPMSLADGHVPWLTGITPHGLHLSLVGCKIWAANLCIYLCSRFRTMGSPTTLFLVSVVSTVLPPLLSLIVMWNANWQLIVTLAVATLLYVWCEMMPLLAAELFPTSHRVMGVGLGLAASKACSILAYKHVLAWETSNLVWPYMTLAVCGLTAVLLTAAAPEPTPSLNVPVDDAARWLRRRAFVTNASRRINHLLLVYLAPLASLHAAMLAMAIGGAGVGGFAVSKVLAFFLPRLRHSLLMPRTSMSFLYTVSVVGAAVLQPALGALVDEYGYRQAFACTSPILGLGFVALALAEWVRYDTLLNMGLGGAVLLMGIGLFLLRVASVTVQTIASTLVNQWFDKQRGQATAMYHLGFMAVQDLVLVQIVQFLSWQTTVLCATCAAVLYALIAWLYVVDCPADAGLRADISPPTAVRWIDTGEGARTAAGAGAPAPADRWPSPSRSVPGARESDEAHDARAPGAGRTSSGASAHSQPGWLAPRHAPASPRLTPRAPMIPAGSDAVQYTLREALRTRAYLLFNAYMVMYAVAGSSTALLLLDIIGDGASAGGNISPLAGPVNDTQYQYPDPRAAGDSGSEPVPEGAVGAPKYPYRYMYVCVYIHISIYVYVYSSIYTGSTWRPSTTARIS